MNADAAPVRLVRKLHANTARTLNRMENAEGRQVWYQYRDTRITFDKSYFARLRYVQQNPVKHGLAKNAENYKWCSAAWFKRTAPLALLQTVENFPIDKLRIEDDFDFDLPDDET